MNEEWVKDSEHSAKLFRSGRKHGHDANERMKLVRMLDATGMYETGWLIYNHLHRHYGYPNE